MKRDISIEKEMIKALASVKQNEQFIIGSLHLMDNDWKREQLIMYIKNNPHVTKKEVEREMFYITVMYEREKVLYYEDLKFEKASEEEIQKLKEKGRV